MRSGRASKEAVFLEASRVGSLGARCIESLEGRIGFICNSQFVWVGVKREAKGAQWSLESQRHRILLSCE